MADVTGPAVGVGVVADTDLVLVECDPYFREVFGGWAVGEPARAALPGKVRRPLVAVLADVARHGGPRQSVVPLDGPSREGGAGRYCVVSCTRAGSGHGSATTVLVSVFDGLPGASATDPGDAGEGAGPPERDRALERYEALLSGIPQVVWSMSAEGRVDILVGRRGDLGDFQQHDAAAGAWMEAVHPKDRAWFAPQWQATAEGQAILDAVVRVRQGRQSNEYSHVNIVAVPVMRDGRVTEWIGTAADAETQWRARMRERLLSRMVAVPAARDLQSALATAASAVVPDVVDVFAVFQLWQGGRVGFDPRRGAPISVARAGMSVADGLPTPPALDTGFHLGPLALKTITDQQVQRVVFAPGNPPESGLSDEAHAWMRQAKASGVTMMPVVIDGRTVALAGAANCGDNPPPSDTELALLGEVLNELGGPLRRTFELETARTTALTLQRSFLTGLPTVDAVEMAALYQPADAAAEVGGDWYDVTPLPDGAIALTIGDVAGHDLAAATMMGRVNSMLRGISYVSTTGPAHVMGRLDEALHSLTAHTMITAVHAVAARDHDGWCLTVSNAGHPPPLIIPSDGAPSRYLHPDHAPDPPLGAGFAGPRHEHRHRLAPGDMLVLYTDGLVEEHTADITDRLSSLLRHADAVRDDARTPDELLPLLLRHAGTPTDDIAMLAFRVQDPRRAPAPR
ncbi:SpoIIE family protein phosphatase [Actinacidiphila alni]|nr:SpoIIE family protein phosphatase [Actinacidiphila alni]